MLTAIIKKDIRAITANKRLLSAMLIVPLVLTLLMPSMLILSVHFAPAEAADFQVMLDMLPAADQGGSLSEMIIRLVMNNIMPIFFLLIPIMTASVMAASSFVGEKEKRTLETLLYCPLPLKQIFRAKVLASFLTSMAVSLLSFLLMVLAVELEVYLTSGGFWLPNLNWLILLLLVSPAIALIAITLIVRASAKAKTVEESQQGAVFLILPVMLLVAGQFSGILLIEPWLLLMLGLAAALLAFLLLRRALGRFTYETLLA